MVWAMENPNCGLVEPDEMDFRRNIEICSPYLGKVVGQYTDWTPLLIASGCSPRTSTRAIRGSSRTCGCSAGSQHCV